MRGRTVCLAHGGRTPVGVAASSFKHGRYSKHVPAELLDRYHDGTNDPELLSLRDDIAILDAHMTDIILRLDRESVPPWRRIRQSREALEAARSRGNTEEESRARAALETATAAERADEANWREIIDLIGERRTLVESERRRMVMLRQYITAEQAMTFSTAVVEAVRRHVTDPKALRAISQELARLLEHTMPQP